MEAPKPSDIPPSLPANTPEGEPPSASAPIPRIGRALMLLVAAFYIFSAGAAVWLIWRSTPTEPAAGMESPKVSLLKGRGDGIALIRINGPIFGALDSRLFMASPVERFIKRLKELSERKEVKAIVIQINSPGGSVGMVQEVYSQIQKIKKEKKKPIVASFNDIAASGGYYIACACDKIIAHPGTLTGSIGVIFQFGNVQELFRKIGVRAETIKSGKHKDIGSPTRRMTPEEKQILQGLIDDAYNQFLTAVSEGRKMPKDKLKTLADGRIFTGNQALQSGLIDALGDTDTAIQTAAEMGGIKGKPKIYSDQDPWESIFSIIETWNDNLNWGTLNPLKGPLSMPAGLFYLHPWEAF